jgi:hypothetical protein
LACPVRIEESEWQECISLIEQQPMWEFIIVSGSLPPGVPLTIFSHFSALADKIGAKLIVDTSGKALMQAAKEGVYLLKPNLAELSALAGKEEINAEQVDDLALEIINSGPVRGGDCIAWGSRGHAGDKERSGAGGTACGAAKEHRWRRRQHGGWRGIKLNQEAKV